MINVFERCADVEIARFRYCGADEWLQNPTIGSFDEVQTCMTQVNSQASKPEFCINNSGLCVPQNTKKACMNNNIKNSLYITQVQEWVEMYDKDQLLIVRSEDLYTNTSLVMTEISRFLNLREFDWDAISSYAYNIVNPGTKSADNHVLITENRAGLFIGGTSAENTHNYPELPARIKDKLNAFFAPFNQLLAETLDSPAFW